MKIKFPLEVGDRANGLAPYPHGSKRERLPGLFVNDPPGNRNSLRLDTSYKKNEGGYEKKPFHPGQFK